MHVIGDFINNFMFKLKNNNFKNLNFPRNLYEYDFIMNLPPKDWEKYLKKTYEIKLKKPLNLKNPKSYTEKIQWLKLYDNLPVKTDLTDKFKVREFVENKIGKEYLKPLLQVCNNFDEVDFHYLPETFVLKCNHGCKWQFIIKNKKAYLENEFLFKYTKRNLDIMIQKCYFGFGNFETQYINIEPKLLVEEYLTDTDRDKIEPAKEIEVLCFNGEPKITETHRGLDAAEISVYDENFNPVDLKYTSATKLLNEPVDTTIKQAVELSKILAKDFKLVRVDWMIYKDKLYFNELTFTPRAGFIIFPKGYEHWDKYLGKMINITGEKHG